MLFKESYVKWLLRKWFYNFFKILFKFYQMSNFSLKTCFIIKNFFKKKALLNRLSLLKKDTFNRICQIKWFSKIHLFQHLLWPKVSIEMKWNKPTLLNTLARIFFLSHGVINVFLCFIWRKTFSQLLWNK